MGVDDGRIDLLLRESHLGEGANDIKDPEITSISDLKVGMTRCRIFHKVQEILLGRNVTG